MSISCSKCTNNSGSGCKLGLVLRPDVPTSFAELRGGCSELTVDQAGGASGSSGVPP